MGHGPNLDHMFGAAYISVVVAAMLYGVSFIQAFYYFRRYSRKDGWGTKAVVIITLMSDAVHQALISQSMYTYLVMYRLQPQKLKTLIRSPSIAVLFSGITAFLVQSFYAVRIWRFSGKNVAVTGTLFVVIVAGFVSVISYSVKAIHMTTFAELATLGPWTITVNGLAAVADTLIVVVFCVLLRKSRSQSLQRSNMMIDLLIAFSVQSGMLTSLCAIAALVSVLISPYSFLHAFFYFLERRLYCNSLLATLNVRDAIRRKGNDNAGISLPTIGGSSLSTADIYKGIIFTSDAESYKHIPGTEAHDGNANNSQVSSGPDERDIGDESCCGRHPERTESFHVV